MAKDDMVFHSDNIKEVVGKIEAARSGLAELKSRLLRENLSNQAELWPGVAVDRISHIIWVLEASLYRLEAHKLIPHTP